METALVGKGAQSATLSARTRKSMEILYIGGVADRSTMKLPESVEASRHSFKPEGDFPSDALHHHDYERKKFSIEQVFPEPRVEVHVMVYVGLPPSVACVLVGAHFGGSADLGGEESN